MTRGQRVVQLVVALALVTSALTGQPVGIDGVGTAQAASEWEFVQQEASTNGNFGELAYYERNFYASPSQGSTVYVFPEDFGPATTYDISAETSNGLAITVNSDKVYISDYDASEVDVYDLSFNYVKTYTPGERYTSFETVSDGYWATIDSSGIVYKLDDTFNKTGTSVDISGEIDEFVESVNQGDNGHWYVTQHTGVNSGYVVDEFDENWGHVAEYDIPDDKHNTPEGAAQDPLSGDWFLADKNGGIYKYTGEETKFDVTGTVTFARNGSAVTSEQVELVQSGSVVGTDQTDSNGDYAFFDQDGGTYTVRADLSGFTTDATTVDLSSSDATADLSISAYQLRIRSLNQTGAIVPDADVTIEPPTGADISETTNSTGWNVTDPLAAEAGDYKITVNKQGFAPRTKTVTLSESDPDKTVVFNLARAAKPYVFEATPRGGEYVKNRSDVELRAVVKDPEGDDITVKLYHKTASASHFTKVNDTTVPSGGLVTADVEGTQRINRWKANLTDTDGKTRNSSVYTYTVAGYIRVRYDSNLSLATKHNLSANYTSISSTFSRRNFTETGIFDLNNVPKEPMRIAINNSSFVERKLLITAPSRNYTTTILPLGATVTQCFELDDKSGNYPLKSSYVTISREIQGTEQRIAGEVFGAGNLACVELVKGRTYSDLSVRNFKGDRYSFGSHTQNLGDREKTIVLTIPQNPTTGNDTDLGDISTNTTGVIRYAASLNEENEYIWFRYSDLERNTSELNVTIWELGNRSNEIFSKKYTTLGNLTDTAPLDGDEVNGTWVVFFNASRTSDPDPFTARVVVGREQYDPGVPLSPEWRHRFALLSIFFAAAVAGGVVNKNAAAIVVVLWAGLLRLIGWAPPGVTGLMIAGTLAIVVLLNIGDVASGVDS